MCVFCYVSSSDAIVLQYQSLIVIFTLTNWNNAKQKMQSKAKHCSAFEMLFSSIYERLHSAVVMSAHGNCSSLHNWCPIANTNSVSLDSPHISLCSCFIIIDNNHVARIANSILITILLASTANCRWHINIVLCFLQIAWHRTNADWPCWQRCRIRCRWIGLRVCRADRLIRSFQHGNFFGLPQAIATVWWFVGRRTEHRKLKMTRLIIAQRTVDIWIVAWAHFEIVGRADVDVVRCGRLGCHHIGRGHWRQVVNRIVTELFCVHLEIGFVQIDVMLGNTAME